MTRGQESLVMELEAPAAVLAAAEALRIDVSSLIVVPALPDEVALHETYLDAMEKDAKGPRLWRRLFG
jgi:DNA polymerase-3 subunit epsilon